MGWYRGKHGLISHESHGHEGIKYGETGGTLTEDIYFSIIHYRRKVMRNEEGFLTLGLSESARSVNTY